MPVVPDTERPNMRLPFTRVERANGLLLWLFVSFPVSFVVFIASRFLPQLHTVFTLITLGYALTVVVFIAEYFIFEERISIETDSVRYRRKSVFGNVEWTERLKNFTGVVVITNKKEGTSSSSSSSSLDAPSRSHWTKRPAPKFIRLVGRDTTKSVILWEFEDRDFPQAVNKKLQSFAEMLDLPALPGQAG